MIYDDIKPPDRILFGQYLIEEKIIDMDILKKALEIQDTEKGQLMKDSHRLLGIILMQDFDVFKSRIELNRYMQKFIDFKEKMERVYYEARNLKR